MDLNFISEYYMPMVLTASFIIGYVIKKSLDFYIKTY